MAESSVPGLGDLFALVGSNNPFASIGKSIEQFRRGVEGFLASVETFNQTMGTLNGVASRVTTLLDEIEDPIKALMPQITRSIKASEAMINQLSGPVEKVAPGLSRLAETLGSPVFANMPTDIGTFLDTLGDLARRMQPLAQMAESAGGLFGLRPLQALRSGTGRPATPPPVAATPPPPPPPPKPVAKKPVAKKAAPRKSPAKKVAAKKVPAKKSSARNR